jgi:crotonobetainyl-CoA:carnitine CoA-transferase CaiB-like acyl-CoA transferase
MSAERPTPLAGLCVVDTAEGRGEMCGRYLADLGADVVRVEPPGGAASRADAVRFAVVNLGKRSTTASGAALDDLLAAADIWIAGAEHDVDAARARNPALVVLSITDFGLTGPYRDWVATDATLLAMGGVLSRSGLPGREPLLPPGELALQATAMQAAWAALVAYWNRLESGAGDHIDFSLYEATAQVVDPALGTVGTAQAAGYEPTRGRPAPGPYPIFRCRDGHVRLVLLAPRQWHAMRAWLGEPEELQDPELDTIAGRARAAGRLHAIFEAHFRDRGKHALTLDGQARGVPIAPVLTPADVLAAEHFRARGAIARVELADGLEVDAPTGLVELDGRRVRAARRAPRVGEHDGEGFAPRAAAATTASGAPRARPLAGLRVLDLGVIVLGAELGRLFCDQGADVIKIESSAFPDGARVSPRHFAIGHRGSRSVGLNLRNAEGLDVLKRLIARADVLLANFKPGTLEKLGLGPEVLRQLNPRLVVASSSAMGESGPWSTWMGYGPLVRCASGLTSLSRYADDPEGFGDGTTIHPDHYAARVAAVGVLAALIARRRSGRGAVVATSQAETILMQLGAVLAQESLAPGSVGPGTDALDAPWGVYPCSGDDEWCVVTVRDDEDWRRLRAALGDPAWAAGEELATASRRVARRAELDARLAAWTGVRPPREVAAALQAAGVPAGFMQRADEYERDPQLQARDFFRVLEQPGQDPIMVDNAPFRSERIPEPPPSRAPELGEHTREVCRELLGMDAPELDRLVAAGALEESVQPRVSA